MRKLIIILLVALISGFCLFASVEEGNEQFIEEAHSQGFEVFYFVEDEFAANHGYGLIYTEKNGVVSTLNSGCLDYNQYVGKLCYFKDPIEGKYGSQFLPLVTELGQTVYVQFYNGRYGNSPSFIYGGVESYDKLVEAQSLISSNLFEDYDVKIEDVEIYSYGERYILSDGNTIWKSSYDFLDDLVRKLSFENAEQRKAFISNALDSGISTTYDDFDEETTMSVHIADDIELYAYVTNDGSLKYSFILLSYSGGSWKFIDSVRMKSNSLEYSFSDKSYRSVMSGGNVFESVTTSISPKSELFNFLLNACETGSLKIRMSGSRGSVDLSINDEQLHRIEAFLRVIECLGNN